MSISFEYHFLSFLGFIYNPLDITTDKNYFLVKKFFPPNR